jgi:putative restriction endonuclease
MREENPEDTRLEKYLQMFRNLQTDRGWDRYPEITYYRAPHNPFLLLSIIDLIAQGRITENLIEPSCELVDTFNTYWATMMPPGSTASMDYLFSILTRDGFWQRVVGCARTKTTRWNYVINVENLS